MIAVMVHGHVCTHPACVVRRLPQRPTRDARLGILWQVRAVFGGARVCRVCDARAAAHRSNDHALGHAEQTARFRTGGAAVSAKAAVDAAERAPVVGGLGVHPRRVERGWLVHSCAPMRRLVSHETRLAIRKRSAGTVLEAVRGHVRRITSQGDGEVIFLYTPAHTGGISANAYADATAKAHLDGRATEPVLDTTSRLCVFSLGGEEGAEEWRLSADKPQYKLMHGLAMAQLRVAPEGQPSVAERLGITKPWQACMRQRPANACAGGAASSLSGVGRKLAAQHGRFGSFADESGGTCELCGGAADLLHEVSGECTGIPVDTRRRHREAATAALLHAATALPTPPAEGPEDHKGTKAPRPRTAGPSKEPAGDDGWFRFSKAHAGQCQSDQLMQVQPGSTEDAYLTHWLALAIVRARSTAESEGVELDAEARLALDEVQVEMRGGRPFHTGGIRAVHVVMGQLKPIEAGMGAPTWAADQARAERAGGERGYVRCERRPEGDAVEAVAFTPAGTQ